jgi:hypothetical protein
MSPDDILKQLEPADSTLNLTRDLIRRLMVAVRIVSPADEKRARADFPHAINDGVNRALGRFAMMRDKAIWQPEENHILWPQPKLRASALRFRLAEQRQPVRRMGLAVWMRPGAIADDDNLPEQTLSASVRDQTAATEALVVRMRRDNDEWPALERLPHWPKREPISGFQEFVRRHRHRSWPPFPSSDWDLEYRAIVAPPLGERTPNPSTPFPENAPKASLSRCSPAGWRR